MAMNPRLLRPRASQQAAPCTYPASLLLHFDGNFTDSSENGLTVTANGDAATSTAQSKFGGASLLLDGTGDSCLSASSSAFAFDGPFTIEAWIYAVSWPSYCWLCDFRNGGDFTFGFGSGAFYPYFGGMDHGAAGTALPAGQWVHVAFVYDGNQCRMYADGVLYRTVTEPGWAQVACSVAIGSRYTQETEFFNGYIDDLRITKGLAVYDCTFSPPAAPLSACVTPVPTSREASLLMHFDGANGSTTFTDSSPNALTVTADGNAEISTAHSKWGGSSLYLDGSSTLTIAYDGTFDFGGGDFTIEAWVRPENTQANTAYGLVCAGGFPGGWAAYTEGGDGNTALNSGSGGWSGNALGTGPQDDEWSHVAFVKTGGTMMCFVNGSLAGSAATSQQFDANSEPLTIGSDRTTGGYKFVGYIDDLRIVKGLAVYKGPFTPPTAPLTAVATPAPVNASLCLNFDGNFTDESVNALTVTAHGGAEISTTQSKFGGSSAAFYGDPNDYATTPSTAGMAFSGDFTIEAWTYWTGDGSETFVPIVSCTGAGDASGWLITSIGGAMYFLGSSGSGWNVVLSASPAMIQQNQWSHLAVVRSGEVISIYIDGTAVASTNSSTAFSAGDDFYLGHYPVFNGTTPLSFTGYIDGLRITKAALYCADFTPPTAPPTPTAVPPCCPASAPACPAYGTYLRSECQGWDYGDVYADGECGEYFEVTSYGGCE